MSNDLLNSLLKEYAQKKLKAEIDLEKRKETLYSKYPKLQKIENELNTCAISTAKNIINNNSKEEIDSFKKKLENLKYEKACILNEAGIDYNYLKPFYDCPICKDTGYVKIDNYKSQMCSCLKQRLLNESFNKSNIYDIEKNNFESFNASLFSDEVDLAKYKFNISPRENILRIKEKCIEFIDNFDNPDYKNLLFIGNTGLRKIIYVQLYCKGIIKKRENCFISNCTCFIRKYY